MQHYKNNIFDLEPFFYLNSIYKKKMNFIVNLALILLTNMTCGFFTTSLTKRKL